MTLIDQLKDSLRTLESDSLEILRRSRLESDYIDKNSEEIARVLRESVEAGKISVDGQEGFYVRGCNDNKVYGLLAGLGLCEGYAIGEDVSAVPLTERGINLGKRLLEESRQIVSAR